MKIQVRKSAQVRTSASKMSSAAFLHLGVRLSTEDFRFTMRNYKKRVVEDLLVRKLRGMGAVLVQGAKWCGKTTTCEVFAKSALYMADPDTKEANLNMADMDIKPKFVS